MSGGWSGLNLNTGPGNWPGYTANMPVENLSPIAARAPLQPLTAFMPQLPGQAPGGWFGIDGLGKNLDTVKMGVGVLGGIANIWNASQQNKLAKASFNHQKGILDTNLANQIKSYNLSVDDKFRSRAVMEGRNTDADIAKWSAKDERRG